MVFTIPKWMVYGIVLTTLYHGRKMMQTMAISMVINHDDKPCDFGPIDTPTCSEHFGALI